MRVAEATRKARTQRRPSGDESRKHDRLHDQRNHGWEKLQLFVDDDHRNHGKQGRTGSRNRAGREPLVGVRRLSEQRTETRADYDTDSRTCGEEERSVD